MIPERCPKKEIFGMKNCNIINNAHGYRYDGTLTKPKILRVFVFAIVLVVAEVVADVVAVGRVDDDDDDVVALASKTHK